MNSHIAAQVKPLTTSAPAVDRSLGRRRADVGSPERKDDVDERRQPRGAEMVHPGLSDVPPIVSEVVRSAGQPLDAGTRAVMEPGFGHDFGNVRVHTGAKAAEAARAASARAYTVGNDIVFGEDAYAPGLHAGQELLAHELAHTVQQGGASRALSSPASDEVLESSAAVAGREVANRRPPSIALPASGVTLARAAVPIDAYTDDMLEKALQEVSRRLKEKSYPGRDRDVDRHMALKWEADKRARAAAQADAEATGARVGDTLRQIDAEEKAEARERNRPRIHRPSSLKPSVEELGAPPQFDYDKFERALDSQKEAEKTAEAAAQKRQDESRPARLAAARRHLTLHGLRRGDEAEVMGRFLTTTDLLVLRKHGLEPPGILSNFGGRYAENAIEVIDKIVPRDPMEDRANLEDLRSRAGAIEHTAEKIDSMKKESAHAFLGRLEGTAVAYLFGKDPIQGGEIGASIGGVAGAKREVGAWASLERPAREPSNEPAAPESANDAPTRPATPASHRAAAAPREAIAEPISAPPESSGALPSSAPASTPVRTPASPQTPEPTPRGAPRGAFGNWFRGKILSAALRGAAASEVLPSHTPAGVVGKRPAPTLSMPSPEAPASSVANPSASAPAPVQTAETAAQASQVPVTPRPVATTAAAPSVATAAQTAPAATAVPATPAAIDAQQHPEGAQAVQVSPAEYAARLSMVTPQQYDDPVIQAVEMAGQVAAAILTTPNTPAGDRFIQTCQNRNWALAGTLFHAEAARQIQAIGTAVPGARFTAEDTVQAGKGGSRLDVTAVDAAGNHYDIDWKTTGRSAFSSKARAELQRHATQYQANRGAPLDVQISKSWVDFVRALIPNVRWPK